MSATSKIVNASANAKMTSLEAKIVLGEQSATALGVPVGTEIDLGVLAYHHRNPLKRLAFRLRQRFGSDKRNHELARRYDAFAKAQGQEA
jgi:ABC-type lipoprotein release transport system permease subunit